MRPDVEAVLARAAAEVSPAAAAWVPWLRAILERGERACLKDGQKKCPNSGELINSPDKVCSKK
jgi:hypothetical protein